MNGTFEQAIKLANKLRKSTSKVTIFTHPTTGQRFIIMTEEQLELLTKGGKVE